LKKKLENDDLLRFIETHDVLYIRHLMSSNMKAYGDLISNKIAAIHYQHDLKKDVDRAVLDNHKNYKNYKPRSYGRAAIKRLVDYSDKGAIVVADYTSSYYTGSKPKNPKTINIGILRPKTTVKVELYEPESDEREKYKYGLIYKQVALENVVPLGQTDCALLLAIHPRGNTVVHWEEGEEAIKFIYKRTKGLKLEPSELSFKTLFPAQQEVLCSEYLRLKGSRESRLKYLLLPVGRGMKSLDIFGSNERKLVLGQVSSTTKEKDIEEKIESLRSAIAQADLKKKVVKVYFGPENENVEKIVRQKDPYLKFISLDKVFEEMKGIGILEDMLGVEF
jgi:hypothetical protein